MTFMIMKKLYLHVDSITIFTVMIILVSYLGRPIVFTFLSHANTLFFVAVPLQAWSGPEGFRKLSFPGFMTTAQRGGKVVSLTHRPPLPPGNTPGTHFC